MRFCTIVLVFCFLCGPPAKGQIERTGVPVRVIDPDAAAASPDLTVTTINLPANSLAWDSKYQRLYLSLPSAAGANGNAVQVVEPTTGELGVNVFAGSEPNLLSVSPNSSYLYVGLDGASVVQRLTLPSLGTDIQIALGNNSAFGPYFASDLQASPAADETVAMVKSVAGISPAEEGGVVIYDNGVARPDVLCGFSGIGCTEGTNGDLFDSIQWNSDASLMFAANNEDTGFDFYTIPVTATGFGKITDYPGLAGGFGNAIHFDPVTQYVYDDNGSVIDPAAGTLVGTFDASGLMVPDGSLGKAFFLGQNSSDVGSGTYTVTAFDIHRMTPIATATVSNVIGSPTHFIRWGTNGLAFTSANIGTSGGAVYILSGSFVASSPPPVNHRWTRRPHKPR